MKDRHYRHPEAGVGDATEQLLDDPKALTLIRAAQQYDERALADIYCVYADRIFRYIYYRLGERCRAEELTGEVFVRLLENVSAFKLGAQGHALALTGWIYRIAHNLVIDEYRRTHVRSEADAALASDDNGTAGILTEDLHLTRIDLQLALRRLTDEQQAVILLRFDQGLTGAEIAMVLGKTETAVKALQRRALAALARQLEPQAAMQA